MTRRYLTLLVVAGALLFGSCAGRRSQVDRTAGDTSSATLSGGSSGVSATISDSSNLNPRHATGFEVTPGEGYRLLTLHDPQEESGGVSSFALVPRGTSPELPAGVERVEVPVRSVICMTSLQLSNLIALDRTDAVVGITSTRHLHNADMLARIAEGRARRIGIEGNFDPEVIMEIDPDLIIISPYKRGGYDNLRQVGIPLLPHFGYQETTPLGQAEWIRCVGELLGQRAVADSVFAGIERRYEGLRALAGSVEGPRPTVLSGELRGGNWYAVGGESYLARLFRDAGADYFLRNDTRAGGVTLDFESVYAEASGVRYWRILNSFEGTFSYDALRREDARYADFRAWRERGIIYCNMREVPFYESTPVEPDVVLADFIKVFHPELVPDHEPVYYKLLK
ncbi:MAG: ABC transporter substrate-binding protein [Alistipes sp.]|jgi:iron complex transport system substrate-binding protein|nr:ABC transporter substrate-binding protein [Alistipes sp.]